MHEKSEAHDSARTGPAQLHRLRDLLQHRDAEGFASELRLDAHKTRQWFDRGFTQEGYGAEIIQALGTLVLTRMLITTGAREDQTHA